MHKVLNIKPQKKFDSIVALILFFIFFIFMLFLFVLNINTKVKDCIYDHGEVNKLRILNKSFDNFLFQKKVSFINYDKINAKMEKFESILKDLKSKKPRYNHVEYARLLNDIDHLYKTKQMFIEYHKSKNAMTLNYIHYLFELSNTMSKMSNITKENLYEINKILLLLIKSYINPCDEVTSVLEKNVEKLNLMLKQNKIHEFDSFIRYILSDLKYTKEFQKLKKGKNSDLFEAIEKLNKYLQNKYMQNIIRGRKLVMILFFIALVILVILLIMYKHSLKLKNRFASFNAAVENSHNSILVTDMHNRITYINGRVVKETGYSKEELMGKNPSIFKSGIKSEAFYKKMYDKITNGLKWEGEFINKRKDGSIYYEKASIVPIFHDGKMSNYLAIKSNITDYVLEKQKVEHMAYHDALTSLPNRTNLEKFLQRQLYVAKRENYKLAVLFIDLDRFKTINDTLGHDVGDELLVAVANRIKSTLRESDMLARIGGDEFVVVLDMLHDEYSVALVCEKIIESFQKEIYIENHVLNMTLSIGVSLYPDDAKTTIALFKYADVAMYEAKNNGGNGFRYYKNQLSLDAYNRLDIEQSLKKALDNDEFFLAYQPKYNMQTKDIIGLEALARWKNEHIGYISPDKFITMAEEIGDILKIGIFLFEKACIDFIVFQKYCPTLKMIAINISAVQLYQESFVDLINNIVLKVGLETKYIMLEVTETHMMKNVAYSMKVLKKLKEYGFKISMDDFGTGYSSLSYLKQFPIDEVKIDKSFVDNLPDNKDDADIAKAIISLCKNMGYKNVAEGIENKAQEDFLAQNGCEIGQGYYFCKPKTKDDILEFFKEKQATI